MNFFNTIASRLVGGLDVNTLNYINKFHVATTLDASGGSAVIDYNDISYGSTAYGLNTTEGVIVLKTWKHSPAVQNNGIKKGDVILEVNNIKLKNIKDFLIELKNNNKLEFLDIVVMRNQSELSLTIRFK